MCLNFLALSACVGGYYLILDGVNMLIGVPKEIKDHEYRVGLIPDGVEQLVRAGHTVQVEVSAGLRVGFADEAYQAAGARIVSCAAEAYSAELIIKVKELQRTEFALIRAGQVLFCYQHFAPDPELLDAVLAAGVACVAYETVTAPDGSLPLLVPMSQIAGRLAPQVGAWALQMANGGSGILLAGVPGVAPGKVTVIGGGTVGENAARIALGMGAEVTMATRSPARLVQLYTGLVYRGPRLVTECVRALC
jgi:alanine dehydrogenase